MIMRADGDFCHHYIHRCRLPSISKRELRDGADDDEHAQKQQEHEDGAHPLVVIAGDAVVGTCRAVGTRCTCCAEGSSVA